MAKISSIHVNGWFGDYDKLSMTRLALGEVFGFDIDATPEAAAFVGDSPNDAPMFAFFPFGVGVANIRDFDFDKLSHRHLFETKFCCLLAFSYISDHTSCQHSFVVPKIRK